MVFKRREKRTAWQMVTESLWPRGGWARAAQYMRHRLRRLPDSPDRIARGIFAGVFTTFTPFYGLHFVFAGTMAWLMRGNILAAVLSTFFGNPLTYVPIGIASLQTGYYILGMRPPPPAPGESKQNVLDKFGSAAGDLWHNLMAVFTPETANWAGLIRFYNEVFFPYMIGGILPGIVFGLIAYYVSLPVITAYQNRRRGAMKSRVDAMRPKARSGSPTAAE